MLERELIDPQHVTADYTGQPGERVFHIQAADAAGTVTVLCEKGQVLGLAELLGRLLERLGEEPVTEWDRSAMALREPVEPAWRVGELAVGLDVERRRFVLDLAEFVPDAPDEDETDQRQVRIWVSVEQARRLAAHAAEVVTKGRPPGEEGRVVKDATGHVVFPSTNGHGKIH